MAEQNIYHRINSMTEAKDRHYNVSQVSSIRLATGLVALLRDSRLLTSRSTPGLFLGA